MFVKFLINLADKTGIIKLKRLIFKRFNYCRTIYLNDMRIIIPSIHGVKYNSSEMWMFELLHELVSKSNGVFLDIGVNVGQTLVKLKALDPDRNYVGFEPNPTCIYYVNELLKVNEFRNCILVPIGLFTNDGLLPLGMYSDDASDASASLIEEFRPGGILSGKTLVPIFRYDSVASLLGISSVGIVKIDVEGAELDVLNGLLSMIQRDQPVVLLEVVATYEIAFRINRQKKLEDFFHNIGYTIYHIEKTKTDGFAGLKQIEIFSNRDDPTRSDYVVFPHGQVPINLLV